MIEGFRSVFEAHGTGIAEDGKPFELPPKDTAHKGLIAECWASNGIKGGGTSWLILPRPRFEQLRQGAEILTKYFDAMSYGVNLNEPKPRLVKGARRRHSVAA